MINNILVVICCISSIIIFMIGFLFGACAITLLYYLISSKKDNITKIPVLLNTSFNVHGEPIVCHPKEAFVHLDNNIVDRLVINNKTYTKK